MLAPWEEYFLSEIGDLPIEKCPAPDIDQEMKQKVRGLACVLVIFYLVTSLLCLVIISSCNLSLMPQVTNFLFKIVLARVPMTAFLMFYVITLFSSLFNCCPMVL